MGLQQEPVIAHIETEIIQTMRESEKELFDARESDKQNIMVENEYNEQIEGNKRLS